MENVVSSVQTAESVKIENNGAFARNSRQTGFEILRILSLYLICCVHIMNYGGILSHAEGTPLLFLRLLYSIFLVAVNVFVLISGYFMIKSNFKFKKALCLWGQVILYCVVSYLISLLILKDEKFNLDNFVKCFFPYIYQKYWFFTAYIALYLISPVLKEVLNKLSRGKYTALVIALFVFVYLFTRKIKLTLDVLSNGYSIAWFVVLFVFGGYLRLYPPKIHKAWIFIIYLICTLAIWGMWYWKQDSVWAKLIYNTRNYTSPLVVIASLCVILLFKDIRLKNDIIHKIICFISSCTFGIYLFQESAIKPYIYFNLLKVEKYYGNKYSPLFVIGGALAIFLMGMTAEFIRKFIVWLFNLITQKIRSKFDLYKQTHKEQDTIEEKE